MLGVMQNVQTANPAGPVRRKKIIEVRFFGSETLLHDLVAGETLKPIRRGGRVIFSLGDVALLAERVSDLENTLREMAENVNAVLGKEVKVFNRRRG